jgi:tRNA(fMet)-specific endonuclease VapC
MIVLDTDHASLVGTSRVNAESSRVLKRLESVPPDEVRIAIVGIEEQMRGWLAALNIEKAAARQVFAYRELERLFDFYSRFAVLSFDDAAASKFDSLRTNKIRIGTSDLKIASICLVNDATLLTRNTRDFGKVPGLKIEDWTV